MTLTPSSIGPNPQQPGSAAEVYVPDQLIAGNLHLVTKRIQMKAGLSAIVKRGTVLGRTTATTPSSTAAPGNTGNGTVGTISAGATPIYGDFVLTAVDATHFNVVDPFGEAVGVATVGSAFTGMSIVLTITAGGTAFVAADKFTVNVPANGFFLPSVKTASDGSQVPIAIAADDVDTTSSSPSGGAAQTSGAYFTGEFNERALIFDASWTIPLLDVAFTTGIFIKGSVSAADRT